MNSADASKVRPSRPGLFSWFYPLRTRLEAPEVLVVEVPPSNYVKRGLISLVLVPLLLMFLAFLFHQSESDAPPWLLRGLDLFLATVALVFSLVALGMAVGAPMLSRRTVVRFDLGRGVVVRARDGLTAPLADVAGIGLRESGGNFIYLMRVYDLVLVRTDGTALLALDGPIPAQYAARAQATRIEIEAFIGLTAPLPVERLAPGVLAQPSERTTLGLPSNVAAGLCYLPLQGIHILVSIIMLCFSKDRTVRFAAKQSLLQAVFGLLAALTTVGIAVGVIFVAPEGTAAHIPVVVLCTVMLSAVLFWHVHAYIVACVRAFRGRTWVMPWLRWLIGKSAP